MENSRLKDGRELSEGLETEKKTVKENREAPRKGMGAKAGVYLFTTKTCPNCRIAKECLKGTDYTVVDAEENPDMSSRFGIMQAPTLVLVGKDGEIKKFVNASNIRKFAEEYK